MFKASLLPWRNHLTGLDFVALTMRDGLAKAHGCHIQCTSNPPDQGWSNLSSKNKMFSRGGEIFLFSLLVNYFR